MPPVHMWLVVPAAGIGRRMHTELPKQYAPLAGRTVIEWSLAPFLARGDLDGIVVVVAEGDSRFAALPAARDSRVRSAVGGAERAASVLRGVESLDAQSDDWVLVHDAARPCLRAEDLARLINELDGDPVGGLLAVPVADTLKSADSQQRVTATVARERLWQAQTPQMFRYGALRRALTAAATKQHIVTDEASAIELLEERPRLVLGRADNIKITAPEDLVYAEFLLRSNLM